MKMKNVTHKVVAAVSTLAIMASSGDAFADNFADVSTKIVDSSKGIPAMISTVAYICGIGLGAAGIFKLKEHVDNPGSKPMKDGLIRLGAGGGLLALPYLTTAMRGSVGDSGAGVDMSDFSTFEVTN